MTEPMTAAEYRQWCNVGLGVNTERVLAALEERERLLGEREVDAPFAAVGRGLVDSSCTGAEWDRLLAAARAAWDSLLPKEPEVAPSGWTYERVTDSTHYWRIAESGLSFSSATATCIPPIDREYVEKMTEASRGK